MFEILRVNLKIGHSHDFWRAYSLFVARVACNMNATPSGARVQMMLHDAFSALRFSYSDWLTQSAPAHIPYDLIGWSNGHLDQQCPDLMNIS